MFSNTGQEKGNQHGGRENDLQNWLNMTLHEILYTQSIVTGVEHVHKSPTCSDDDLSCGMVTG